MHLIFLKMRIKVTFLDMRNVQGIVLQVPMTLSKVFMFE